ncbi:MAG: hypothetical protein ACE5FN_05945 [Leptospirillia bacterium]
MFDVVKRWRLQALGMAALLLSGCVEAFEVPEMQSPEGKAFIRRCSLCHALPDPIRMTYAGWEVVVARMALNIRAQNVPQMSDEERDQILAYLKRHAKPTPN